MMVRKRMPVRRSGAGRPPDPEVVEVLVNEVLKGGSDRARYLARNASSTSEAEVVRLVNTIREVGADQAPIPEAQLDAIMTALREEASAGALSARWHRWVKMLAGEVLLVCVGSGLAIRYGLILLDEIALSAPGNRIAATLVATCGALVCLLLHRRAVARERLPSG